jgi:hypothetical protein
LAAYAGPARTSAGATANGSIDLERASRRIGEEQANPACSTLTVGVYTPPNRDIEDGTARPCAATAAGYVVGKNSQITRSSYNRAIATGTPATAAGAPRATISARPNIAWTDVVKRCPGHAMGTAPAAAAVDVAVARAAGFACGPNTHPAPRGISTETPPIAASIKSRTAA